MGAVKGVRYLKERVYYTHLDTRTNLKVDDEHQRVTHEIRRFEGTLKFNIRTKG